MSSTPNTEILSQIEEARTRGLIDSYHYEVDSNTNQPTCIYVHFLESTPPQTKINLQDYFLEEHNIHTFFMWGGLGVMRIILEPRL